MMESPKEASVAVLGHGELAAINIREDDVQQRRPGCRLGG